MSNIPSTSSSRTILITGANGFIGSRLAHAAFLKCYRVKTFSRSLEGINPNICRDNTFIGSLPNNICAQALESVDVVAHCAAWTKPGGQMAHAVNVEGTIQLAQLAVQKKVNTFIFISSQSAQENAVSDYGRSKFAAETALLSAFTNSGMNIVILRPGLVTGVGQQGLYRRMCRIVDSWPVIPLVGGGKSIIQPIHVDDLCEAVLTCCLLAPQLNGRILKLGMPNGVSLYEFLQALSLSRRGLKIISVSLPIWPISAGVRLGENFGLRLPMTSENLKGLSAVETMDTKADMALIHVPIRPIDIMLRDYIDLDSSVVREGRLIANYLLQMTPSFDVLVRYARATNASSFQLTQDEQRLWKIVERFPSTLRMIDGALAIISPHSNIRRKIYTMLAILEASPEYCEYFLPKPLTPLRFLGMIGVGLRAGLATIFGLIFLKVRKGLN